VLFACVDASSSFPSGSELTDAHEILSGLHDAGALWLDTSRNWWHLFLAQALACALGVEGLDFLDEECITIQGNALGTIEASIGRLLEAIRDNEISLPDEQYARYAEIVARPENLTRLPTIKPNPRNADGPEQASCGSDEQMAISFYCFLISLKAVAGEALSKGKSLLWAVPPP
jgi:hypothetical protein